MIKSSGKTAKNSISPVISESSTKATKSTKLENDSPQILNCLKEISNNVNTLIYLLEGSEGSPINSASKNSSSPLEDEINDMMNYVDNILEKHKKTKPDLTGLKESTLIISETNNTVTLPYKLSELNAILYAEKSNYENYDQIIQDLYTIPLSNYKNFSFSRFREAYNLVRKKEHGSIKSAIELGVEVFANYNLHPAIITACNNLNEFDVYLSCMEYNELQDFHFFKVEFEAAPALVTNKFKLLKKLNNSSKNTIDLM